MNLAYWFYISGYTPETPKKHSFNSDNPYQWTILLINETSYCFPCKGKCIQETNKNIFPQIEILYYFFAILIWILFLMHNT